MKSSKQKKMPLRAGHVIQAVALGFAVVCCVGCSIGFAHAYFVTERGVSDNLVKIATYAVTVYDGESGAALRPDETGAVRYTCPLTQGDWHYFRLEAEGSAYSGHCTVAVENEQGSYVIRLDPDESGVAAIQAAEGSVLTFAFDWGEGEAPLPSGGGVSGISELGMGAGTGGSDVYIVSHSQTPSIGYTVAQGASLGGIAEYYGITADALCVYNGLGDTYDIWEPLPTGMPMEIPRVEREPVGGPYVPKGDLTIRIRSGGDAGTPAHASILVSGEGFWQQIRYRDFVNGIYVLEDLPAGEYELAVLDADREDYDLETTGDMAAQVTEKGESAAQITNCYTRHVGDLTVQITVSGAQLPEDALLRLYGPEEAFQVACERFAYSARNGYTYTCSDIATGEYTAVLIDAEIENYTLTAEVQEATVEKDQSSLMELDVEYVRQTGGLTIQVSAFGADVPDSAVVLLTGPENVRERIPYSHFVKGEYSLDDLPTGEYTVELIGADVEEHTLTVSEQNVTVRTDKTVSVTLKAKYAAQVGDLTVTVQTDGAPLPEGASLLITGPDGYSETVACERCVLTLPVGTYRISAQGIEQDGYEAEPSPVTVRVTRDGAAAHVRIEYTAAAPELPAADEDGSDAEQPQEQ